MKRLKIEHPKIIMTKKEFACLQQAQKVLKNILNELDKDNLPSLNLLCEFDLLPDTELAQRILHEEINCDFDVFIDEIQSGLEMIDKMALIEED